VIGIIKEKQYNKLVDVRPRAQFNIIHLQAATNIPYDELVKMKEPEL
jgi:rhodanese-related sulfurtransferase